MAKGAPNEIPMLRLSGFAPAIDLLLALELPASRVAELFDTNVNYVYLLAHRARRSALRRRADTEAKHKASIEAFTDNELIEAKQELRIRAEEDGVELTPRKLAKLAWLEASLDDIIRRGRSTYQFIRAARELRALAPYIGHPSETNRLRLAARLHQHLAWFFSHSGFSHSSLKEARRSIELFQVVFQNTDDKDVLRELGGSCLIGSNSLLIQGNGAGAQTLLELGREATVVADVALNSEFFRQFGVRLFQAREDELAKAMFQQAMQTAPDGDLKHPAVTLKMASDRHLNLIASPLPRLDDQLLLLAEASEAFGANSLEATACAHWAAACGLCTDSPEAQCLALELLAETQRCTPQFGQKATSVKLLPIALELPFSKRALWVRFALYQNAYRSK